jgi:hypothetical protein
MSTPPTPAAAPVPPTAQPAQPGLSQVARIINTFIAPRKTFLDIRRSASWWLPWLLGVLSVVGFVYTVEKKVGYEAIVNNRFAHASFLQKAMDQMPPDKKQEMIDKQIASSQRSIYTSPIGALIFALIYAAFLMLTFKFAFDAGVSYKASLAIVFYGWLPKVIFSLIAIVVMVIGVEPEGFDMENPLATQLGVILGSNTDHRFLYHILSGVDLFGLWCVFLMGLGFATVSQKKISTGAAVTAVAAWYVFGILLRAAISPFAS